jgi:hypothetical protein
MMHLHAMRVTVKYSKSTHHSQYKTQGDEFHNGYVSTAV